MTAIAYFIVEGASPELEHVAKQCWSGGFVGVSIPRSCGHPTSRQDLL